MPLPVLPLVIGGGLVALVAAGKREASSKPGGSTGGAVAPGPGAQATPQTQSTGGTNGGAQAASHNDLENNVPTSAPPNGGEFINSAVEAYNATPNPSVAVAQHPASNTDPWAPAPGPSITSAHPQVKTALGTTAGMTTRAVTDTFTQLGKTFGGIW